MSKGRGLDMFIYSPRLYMAPIIADDMMRRVSRTGPKDSGLRWLDLLEASIYRLKALCSSSSSVAILVPLLVDGGSK